MSGEEEMQKSEEPATCLSKYIGERPSECLALGMEEKNEDREEGDICLIWNKAIMPHSKYQRSLVKSGKKKRHLDRVEKLRDMDLYGISPRRLSKILTGIDLSILRRITPSELVEYDGSGDDRCVNIRHMKSKNTGLTNLVSQELCTRGRYKYFFRLLRHLERLRNYNSFYCVIKAFQMQKLDLKRLNALSSYMEKNSSYFDMRQILDELTMQEAFFICPLDIYIKDVEDSNRSRDSEIASMRFCRLVEILIKLQEQEMEVRISDDEEHFLLSKFWSHLQRGVVLVEGSERRRYDGQFLLI